MLSSSVSCSPKFGVIHRPYRGLGWTTRAGYVNLKIVPCDIVIGYIFTDVINGTNALPNHLKYVHTLLT